MWECRECYQPLNFLDQAGGTMVVCFCIQKHCPMYRIAVVRERGGD